MSVLDRSALEASPLADLHTIASELSIDGYRRLRRAELINAIIDKQGGDTGAVSAGNGAGADEVPAEKPKRAPRARRSRAKAGSEPEATPDAEAEASVEAGADADADAQASPRSKPREAATSAEDDDDAPGRRRRGRRGARTTRAPAREETESEADADSGADAGSDADVTAQTGGEEELTVEGVIELLAGGSGFVRVQPPEPSDEDVYISAAQVKRCELVSGDRVSGPKRAPRRSERFASLIRIETINGRPAAELADSVRYDELPAAFPSERIKLGTEDPTVKAIEFLTPFGQGSRVTIVGRSRAGKTEALRRIATALTGAKDAVNVQLVLAGARPEEITEWGQGPLAPAAAVGLDGSEDVQGAAIEPVIDQARRLAARGADAIVLIDSLDGCSPLVARKALGAARNIIDGGSLTVIATASTPVGGETTVIALDVALAGTGRFPALDLLASGSLRPELLVGQAGADAIAAARAQAADRPED